jgi:hypothetical protein
LEPTEQFFVEIDWLGAGVQGAWEDSFSQ